MFDIPELDLILCKKMTLDSLTRCASVNKKWHEAVMPYIWSQIPWLKSTQQKKAFRRMVLDDYLREQQQLSSTNEPHLSTSLLSQPSILRKYAPCIRQTPSMYELLTYLDLPKNKALCTIIPSSVGSTPKTRTDQEETAAAPSKYDLLYHFLSCGPTFKITDYSLRVEDLQPGKGLDLLLDFIIPHTQDLTIYSKDRSDSFTMPQLKQVLAKASDKLKSLTINIDQVACDVTEEGYAGAARWSGCDDPSEEDAMDQGDSQNEGSIYGEETVGSRKNSDGEDNDKASELNVRKDKTGGSNYKIRSDKAVEDKGEGSSELSSSQSQKKLDASTDGNKTDSDQCWVNLISLKLSRAHDNPETAYFWPWLLQKCRRINFLDVEVRKVGRAVYQSLVSAVGQMGRMERVSFGSESFYDIGWEFWGNRYGHWMDEDGGIWSEDEDEDEWAMGTRDDLYGPQMVALISTAPPGLKDVFFEISCEAKTNAFEALRQHAATLESLTFAEHVEGDVIKKLLASSPRLKTLHALDDETYPDTMQFPEMNVKDFIDWDLTTRSPRPWACELSLKNFRIKITGIPMSGKEAYPGERLEILGKVYDRLARFANLRTLCLGHNPQLHGEVRSPGEEMPIQNDCLSINLASGLSKLGHLKRMEWVNISNMAHGFRQVEDAKWVVKHWPKLVGIAGLELEGNDNKAVKWLKKNTHLVSDGWW